MYILCTCRHMWVRDFWKRHHESLTRTDCWSTYTCPTVFHPPVGNVALNLTGSVNGNRLYESSKPTILYLQSYSAPTPHVALRLKKNIHHPLVQCTLSIHCYTERYIYSISATKDKTQRILIQGQTSVCIKLVIIITVSVNLLKLENLTFKPQQKWTDVKLSRKFNNF